MLFLDAESNHREMIEVCESGLRFRSGEREGERIGEMGLFTRAGLEAGVLLGFYTGRVTQEPDKWSVHLMEDCMSMTPVEEGMERPDFSLHPLASINEPERDGVANVFARAELHSLRGSCELGVVVAFYTAVRVDANTELTCHYGAAYEGHRVGYEAGKAANPIPVPKAASEAIESLLTQRPDAVYDLPPDPEATDEESDNEWP